MEVYDEVVQVEKKGNDQFLIFLRSGRRIQVSEEILVRFQLLKGHELTAEEWEEIQNNNRQSYMYQRALYYLNTQLRTQKEMTDYLLKQEFPQEDIQAVMQRLQDLNLINDRIYAESFVRTYMRAGEKGPLVLRQKLKQKGVSDHDINHGLLEYSSEQELTNAYHQAEKLQQKHRNKTAVEQKRKVQQGLLTKGFQTEVIQQVMSELSFERDCEQEQALLEKQVAKLWHRYRKKEPYQRKQSVIASLMRKGFSYEMIQEEIALVEENND